MTLSEITPAQAAALLKQGALLVDIREAPERAAAAIPGSAHVPLSQLRAAKLAARQGQAVIFHCRGGARTAQNAPALKAKVPDCEVYLLKGGIDSWEAAGLPVEKH